MESEPQIRRDEQWTFSSPVWLEHPSEQFRDSYFEAMAEFAAEGIPQMPKGLRDTSFSDYVQQLHDQAAGKNLKQGHMPSIEFWIIDADGYAGRIILGLAYTPGPDRFGHHVGYAVRPSKRRMGYATEALRCLIEEARKLRIDSLMPTCARENIASRKVIEQNGGVILNDGPGTDELRFLIDLSRRDP